MANLTSTPPPRILIPSTTLSPSPSHTSPSQTTPHLPADLRSQINSALLTTSAITSIQSVLLHNLQAAGWIDNVRKLCLELLRSGECARYGELMDTIIREARGAGGGGGSEGVAEREEERRQGTRGREFGVGNRGGANGHSGDGGVETDGDTNGDGQVPDGTATGTSGEIGRRRRGINIDVRIPEKVIDEGVRVIREALEEIVEIV